MDRFEREYLDVLRQSVELAEENLKNATPDQVDALLADFISAKESYYNFKQRGM